LSVGTCLQIASFEEEARKAWICLSMSEIMVSMKRSLRSIDASQELHLEAQATADVLARGFGEDAEDARRRTL